MPVPQPLNSADCDPSAKACEDWFLLQLKPNGYDRAKLNLERQGWQIFMPLKEETARKSGRFVTALKPLFPGYLFIQVRQGASTWRSINNTYGVARLVSLSGDLPTGIAPALMRALLEKTSPDGIWSPSDAFKSGDSVRIVSGPFADHLAKIETVEGKDRVYLFLDLMGRSTRIQANARQLQRA